MLSSPMITVLILSSFAVLNFYLVALSKSVMFALETGLVLRQLGLLLLALGVGTHWLSGYEIVPLAATICVVFYIMAWLNVQIAVRLTKAKLRIATH